MNARPLDSLSRRLRDRRGFVFVFFALSILVLIGLAGLAIDTARGVVNKAEVSRVADSAALAGAKNIRSGPGAVMSLAKAVAGLNGIEPDADTNEKLDITITPNDDKETTISVHASRTIETTFMKVLGFNDLTLESTAEATVPPLDIVMAFDQSYSMIANKSAGTNKPAWDQLQKASKLFVGKFDDDIDQIGLVHFSTTAALAYPLQGRFTKGAQKRIDQMGTTSGKIDDKKFGDTNAEEGLTVASKELEKARPKALRVLVFFTDGNPSAFRHEDGSGLGNRDGILTISLKSGGDLVFGWYTEFGPKGVHPDQKPTNLNPDKPWALAKECTIDVSPYGVPSCNTGSRTWKRTAVADAARDEALAQAKQIRESGVFIYAIGLGNPKATEPDEKPDAKFLKEIANTDGSGGGTVGGYFFADRPEDLNRVFRAVAADILARLSK